MRPARFHFLKDHKERSRKDQTGPSLRLRLKVHEKRDKSSHGHTKEKSREILIRIAGTNILEKDNDVDVTFSISPERNMKRKKANFLKMIEDLVLTYL